MGVDLRVRGIERVKIRNLRRSAAIVLAEIDSTEVDAEDCKDIAIELLTRVAAAQSNYLQSIKTPKNKAAAAMKELTNRLPRAIKRKEAAFLFGAAIGLRYEDRQKLLMVSDEKTRLGIIRANVE